MINLEIWQNIILITLETVFIMIMAYKIDPRMKKNNKKIPVWAFGIAVEAQIASIFEIPFRMFWGIIVMVILLKLLMKIPIIQGVFINIMITIAGFFTQAIMMIPLYALHRTTYTFDNGLIVNVGMILILLIISIKLPIDKAMPFYMERQRLINTLIMIIIVPLVLYSVIWDSNQTTSWQYISLVFTGIIIWTLVVVIVFLEILKIKENKKITQIYNEYNPILQNLIDEVRTKQHDYKNHIQALYSMAELNSDTRITEYIDGLLQNTNNHEQFLKTNNYVVSALLYSKSRELEDKGIQFKFQHDQPLPEYPLKDYELVEVIGNLIDNARDATQALVSEQKVEIKMKRIDNISFIEVSNTGLPIQQTELNNFIKKGFSTKGKNRGYGLYNVNKTVQNYFGTIEVTNISGITTITLAFN